MPNVEIKDDDDNIWTKRKQVKVRNLLSNYLLYRYSDQIIFYFDCNRIYIDCNRIYIDCNRIYDYFDQESLYTTYTGLLRDVKKN